MTTRRGFLRTLGLTLVSAAVAVRGDTKPDPVCEKPAYVGLSSTAGFSQVFPTAAPGEGCSLTRAVICGLTPDEFLSLDDRDIRMVRYEFERVSPTKVRFGPCVAARRKVFKPAI